MGFIYLITNTATPKVYVGQTKRTIADRWAEHTTDGRAYKEYIDGERETPHSCSYLYRAMAKHGVENFSVRMLAEVPKEQLDETEIKYIAEYDCVAPKGYNLTKGGRSHKVVDGDKLYYGGRKHGELEGLPMHCIYLEYKGEPCIAINKHPLCRRKNFMVKKYGSVEAAKAALLKYLAELTASGQAYKRPEKKGNGLPKGIRQIKTHFFIDKTIKGVKYHKYFSGGTQEENLQRATEYLNELIKQHS